MVDVEKKDVKPSSSEATSTDRESDKVMLDDSPVEGKPEVAQTTSLEDLSAKLSEKSAESDSASKSDDPSDETADDKKSLSDDEHGSGSKKSSPDGDDSKKSESLFSRSGSKDDKSDKDETSSERSEGSERSEVNVSDEISLTENDDAETFMKDDADEQSSFDRPPFDDDEEADSAHIHPAYYEAKPPVNSLERHRWSISAFMFTSILSFGVLAATFPVYNSQKAEKQQPEFSVVSDVDVTGNVPPLVIQTLRQAAGFSTSLDDEEDGSYDRQRLLDLLDSRIRGVERNSSHIRPQSSPGQDLDAPSGLREARLIVPATPAAAKAEDLVQVQTVKCEKGDTLTSLLSKAGVRHSETAPIITALSQSFNPRHLRAGQQITFTFQKSPRSIKDLPKLASADMSAFPIEKLFDFSQDADDTEETFEPRMLTMDVHTEAGKYVRVERVDLDSFTSAEMETELFEQEVRVNGTIDSSLFLAAQEQGVPASVIVELIRMYSYDVDFQRQIRKGDGFEIFFKRYDDADGNMVRGGDIMMGSLVLKGKQYAYYSYTTPDDNITDYYDENGVSAKKFLMKTPVDGARLTSRYGMRRHPISGYTKMHKGMDFAAPRGTPIMAAGNGTVELAQRNGGYGNYIRIRHANGYKTAYAHLNGYASGIKKGAHVKQGEIIGYIGSTGRSTGPHLHYEVHLNGNQINPASIRIPSGRTLKGEMLEAFKRHIHEYNIKIANLPQPTAKPMTTALQTEDEHRG